MPWPAFFKVILIIAIKWACLIHDKIGIIIFNLTLMFE